MELPSIREYEEVSAVLLEKIDRCEAEILEPLSESHDRASRAEDRSPRPNVRGWRLSWFVMIVLPPVARITNSPWRSAYASADFSASR